LPVGKGDNVKNFYFIQQVKQFFIFSAFVAVGAFGMALTGSMDQVYMAKVKHFEESKTIFIQPHLISCQEKESKDLAFLNE
jgi:hypothetical protein